MLLSRMNENTKRLLTIVVAVLTMTAGTFGLTSKEAKADGLYCGYWVLGLIEAKYLQKGGLGGPLGCPTSNELSNPPGSTGKRSEFGNRGIVYWKNYAPAAHPVWGSYSYLLGPGRTKLEYFDTQSTTSTSQSTQMVNQSFSRISNVVTSEPSTFFRRASTLAFDGTRPQEEAGFNREDGHER